MSADQFTARVGNDCETRELTFSDPIVTGRQVLEEARQFPPEEFMLLVEQSNGMLEEINLSETVDLRKPGIEQFFIFRADRIYYFEIDSRRFPWGDDTLEESTLKRLAGVGSEYRVWIERRGQQEDEEVPVDGRVDLTGTGVERLYTGIPSSTAGLAFEFLPSGDQRYLTDRGLTVREVEFNGQKGLVFPDYEVGNPELDQNHAELLIVLPGGYPDAPPDMFFVRPWLRLSSGNRFPQAADQEFQFAGEKWQRWSRHNSQWRPGVDGIWTMLRRVDRALRSAK